MATIESPQDGQSIGSITDVSSIVGPFGLWQLTVFMTAIYVEFIAGIYNLASPLYVTPVKFNCNLNETLNTFWKNVNSNDDNLTLDNFAESEDHCKYTVFLNVNNSLRSTRLRRCTHFNFSSVYTRSATEEWSLICDRDWLVSFTSSMTLLGDLIACVLLGHLADRIGRKKTMYIALCTTIVSPFITLFSKTYTQFVIGRFFCGASGFGFKIIVYVILQEIVGINYRGLVGIFVKFGYTFGGVYVGLAAYWLRDWFKIQIASTIPVVILIILCYFLPESPRWLILHGHQDLAKQVLEKGCMWNKKSTADLNVKVEMLRKRIFQEVELKSKTYTAWDLMRTPNIRWKSLILLLCWGASIFIFYGISFNGSTFSDDMFMSFIAVSLMEIPAHFLSFLGIHYVGCKYAIEVFYVFTSIMCFIGAGTKITTGWQGILMMSLMKMGITGCSHICYNLSAEVYPTVMRGIGLGVCSAFGRLISMASPFMKEVVKKTNVSVPYTAFGVLCLVAGISVMLLPNTHKTLLPETVEDCEKINLVNPCLRRTKQFTLKMKRYATN